MLFPDYRGSSYASDVVLYIVKGWGYEWFLRYLTFNEVGWVGGGGRGHVPVGIPSLCHWICLIIKNTNIYGLGLEL